MAVRGIAPMRVVPAAMSWQQAGQRQFITSRMKNVQSGTRDGVVERAAEEKHAIVGERRDIVDVGRATRRGDERARVDRRHAVAALARRERSAALRAAVRAGGEVDLSRATSSKTPVIPDGRQADPGPRGSAVRRPWVPDLRRYAPCPG